MRTEQVVDSFVGLQWGSEGKGAICAQLARNYSAAVRTGAPNAGHTIIDGGTTYKMRSIPCAWVNRAARLLIGAGGLVNMEVLKSELLMLPRDVKDRLVIDRNAGIVDRGDAESEEYKKMNAFNGSTAEGVGPAQARKVLRQNGVLARDVPFLQNFMGNVADELNDRVDMGEAIMLEGTQGFGLCLNHGDYPFVTSRDVLASSLLSDAGLAPQTQRHVYGILRTYPIRVAGNSGPMGDKVKEITWRDVEERCGAPVGSIIERTTVTNRIRRVSELNWDMLHRAVKMNRPNGIFVTFLDYLDWKDHLQTEWSELTMKSRTFIDQIQNVLDVPVLGVTTGPDHLILSPWAYQVAPWLEVRRVAQ